MHNNFCLTNNSSGDGMKIEDIMSKRLVVCKNTDTIQKVSELMKKYDVGLIPITKAKKIIGVITDRDIVVKALATCAKGSTKVEDYISPSVFSCEVTDDVCDVLKCMSEHKIKRVIISDNGKMVGIVSISDLLDEKGILDTIKNIYQINRNSDYYPTEIDDFYL